MPITVYEQHGSPEARFVNPVPGSGSTFRYTYVVLGTSNATEAATAVAGEAPLSLVDPVDGATLVRQEFVPRVTGHESWEVEVGYGPEDDRRSATPQLQGEWRFSFNTTGATAKVTQSLETKSRTPSSGSDPAPDLKGAIGWDGKKVNGVEIVVPSFEFEIVAAYAPASVTMGWAQLLARNTGRTNNAAWNGFATGEALYLGSVGSGDIPLRSGARSKPIEVTHKFSASENQTNIAVGDLTVASKRGHEYLWVRYKDYQSADAKNIIATPSHAYVERLYEEASFSTLFGF